MDVDTIRCPRCDENLQTYLRRGASQVVADMCDTCGGVWLDGKEVAAVYPAFAGLVDRFRGSGAEPVPGGIACCPRCRETPRTFRFFELTLDVCLACHGLWVDGEELADLARTADRADGLPAPEASEHGYRENAASAVRRGQITCKRCAAAVGLQDAEPTSIGPMCGPCARSFRDQQFDAAMATYELPKNPLVDLSFFAEALRELPTAISHAGSALGSCPHCRCSRASRCHC
jgi:Zn-finger nucleic acid-binding protein